MDQPRNETEKDRIAQRLTFAFVTMGFDPEVEDHLRELAEVMAVSTQDILDWTSGSRLPALWRIAEIARHSGLSALWLLSAQGPMEAGRIVDGLVLKTQNDELIGMASPVESETAGLIIELANEVNEALAEGRMDRETENHVQQLIIALRNLLQAGAREVVTTPSGQQYA